ncbi:MAG TPA: hypothetical protein O0Y05_03370, partial [Methanocorpusculum sp.]|nr:hypothetical protein [Methanocorpusculum sp.]
PMHFTKQHILGDISIHVNVNYLKTEKRNGYITTRKIVVLRDFQVLYLRVYFTHVKIEMV